MSLFFQKENYEKNRKPNGKNQGIEAYCEKSKKRKSERWMQMVNILVHKRIYSEQKGVLVMHSCCDEKEEDKRDEKGGAGF